MGPFGVVEADPLADDPFGLETVCQLVQVDGQRGAPCRMAGGRNKAP